MTPLLFQRPKLWSYMYNVIFISLFCFVQWPVYGEPPMHKDQPPVSIGLLLNPERALSVLERGPAADSPEVRLTPVFLQCVLHYITIVLQKVTLSSHAGGRVPAAVGFSFRAETLSGWSHHWGSAVVWILHLPEETCPARDHHPPPGTVRAAHHNRRRRLIGWLIDLLKCVCANTFIFSSFFSVMQIYQSHVSSLWEDKWTTSLKLKKRCVLWLRIICEWVGW